MNAALVLQSAVHPAAFDRRDRLLQAAGIALADRYDVEFPAVTLAIALVHVEELCRKERSLFAAGASADFQQDVLLVVGILRDQQNLDFLEQPRAPDI